MAVKVNMPPLVLYWSDRLFKPVSDQDLKHWIKMTHCEKYHFELVGVMEMRMLLVFSVCLVAWIIL